MSTLEPRFGHSTARRHFERLLRDASHDVRYALLQHKRAPGFACLVVVTLAVGIGANITMAGAIDRLLLRPPPYVREPDRVVRLLMVSRNPSGGESVSASSNYPTFLDFQREVLAFEATGAYSSATVSFGRGPEAVEARASLVSTGFFSVYGVNPEIGRLFSPNDDQLGGAQIAVLGHAFWQREFAGDSTAVGRTIRVGSLDYIVVGVAPPGFRGSDPLAPDLWLPIEIAAEREAQIPLSLSDRGSRWLSIVARLRKGSSRITADQQATNVWRQYNVAPGATETIHRVVTASVIPGRGPDRPREVNIALWLAGVSVLVLVIACANVANLLLARAITRRRETAVRIALGSGSSRLARQLIAEGFLLVAFGGIAALLAAILGGRLLQPFLLTEDSAAGFFDFRLFVITAVVAIGTGVLISLVPLVQSIGGDLTTSLRPGAMVAGAHVSRVRGALVSTQAALCMILLVGAALFAQSLRRVESLDLGLDLDRTLIAKINLGQVLLPDAEVEAISAAMLQRVHAVPGVIHVAFAEKDPYMFGRAIAAHTPTRSAESLWNEAALQVPMEADVDSGFFRAVGAGASLHGRDFETTDRRGTPRVAIINEPLSRLLWPDEDALGKCMLVSWEGGDCVTVVGVLRGFWKRSILQRNRLVVYFPMAQNDRFVPPGRMFIATRGDLETVASAVRQAIQSVRSDMPAVSVSRMSDVVGPELKPWRLAATMFGIFGAVAVIVSVVGLYGVVAFTAAQRSSEIAIRIALGAAPKDILAVVARDGLRAVVLGLAFGVIVTLSARRWIGPLLFQTSASDPAIILGVAALLFFVGTVASLIPTLQALQRNPAAVMRLE